MYSFASLVIGCGDATRTRCCSAVSLEPTTQSRHDLSHSTLRRAREASATRLNRATKWGINGWPEALRVELQPDVRVIVIEPGATATELPDHITHADSKRVSKEALDWSIPPHDIADVIAFAVSRPERMTLNEVLVRPTVQGG